MALRTRLVSCAAIGALSAGLLAMTPTTPAQAAATSPTVTYTCSTTGGAGGVGTQVTLTLSDLTDGLTAGTPLQPVLSSGLSQLGSVLSDLLNVVGGVLQALLTTLLGQIPQSSQLTSTVQGFSLQLTDTAHTVVSTLTGSLTGAIPAGSLTDSSPLPMVLGGLTGSLNVPTAGDYDLSVPANLDLSSLVGNLSSDLGCTIYKVNDAVVTLTGGQTRVVVTRVTAKPAATPVATNPCTVAAAKVGTKKTTLKLSIAPTKVKAGKHGRLGVKATYRVRKHGRKLRARGTVKVCDGTTYLGSATLTQGKRTVLLPKLAPGKHLLLVRYSGAGRAKPANKRIVVRVKR